MPQQESRSVIGDWVEEETKHLDIIASWEQLCGLYRLLEFSDPLSDTTRLEEYKWIIHEINKFFTRAKRVLVTCESYEAVNQYLETQFPSTEGKELNDRRQIAYNKLKQQWIIRGMQTMESLKEDEENGLI